MTLLWCHWTETFIFTRTRRIFPFNL